ncbi:hypothetical protein M0R04_13960 [Candidatus Dojkabacteria bacterium]|jgi:hypothetical protein|nr:hypothetical protein [Candidatus Dojkabacteria bacterium]
MAHITKEGYLETTDEDKEALREGTGKNWSQNIINKIVWGDKKYFYENNKNNLA